MNSPADRQNRRRSQRRETKRSTKVTCHRGKMGLGKNVALSVLNVSETGVSIISGAELAVGEEFEVNLLGVTHRQPVKLLANVVWCVETKDGTWCVGAQFQKSLPYRDLLGI